MRVPTNRAARRAECFPHNQIAGQLRRIARPLALTDDLCQISVRRHPTQMAGDVPLKLRARTNPNSSESL